MRCLALCAAIALLLIGPNAEGFAAQRRLPIPITECGDITQAGNYVVENDLILQVSEPDFGTETCLTISAPRVKIDLGGNTITVACSAPLSAQCPPDLGVAGGIGIEVATGANNVLISNGTIEDYVYGIVADQAYYLSASNLALTADVGVTLSDVSRSTVKGITFRGADTRYHATAGPLLYVSGGSNNYFSNLSGETGSDVGIVDAVQIVGSNANSISQLDLVNTSSCSGADILLTDGSSFNVVTGNTLFNLCGSGIEAETGGQRNIITGNNVTTESPAYVFALLDENKNCGSDFWFKNTFSNEFFPGLTSASPGSCIH
jgi:Right handed beta helix region